MTMNTADGEVYMEMGAAASGYNGRRSISSVDLHCHAAAAALVSRHPAAVVAGVTAHG